MHPMLKTLMLLLAKRQWHSRTLAIRLFVEQLLNGSYFTFKGKPIACFSLSMINWCAMTRRQLLLDPTSHRWYIHTLWSFGSVYIALRISSNSAHQMLQSVRYKTMFMHAYLFLSTCFHPDLHSPKGRTIPWIAGAMHWSLKSWTRFFVMCRLARTLVVEVLACSQGCIFGNPTRELVRVEG